jgi:tetratricopeptide (TPR) repeat protein
VANRPLAQPDRNPLPTRADELPALFPQVLGRQGGAGQVVEVTALYDRILALDPNLREVHNNLGAAQARLGRPAEAEAANRRAIALRPDAQAWQTLGILMVGRGALAEGRDCFAMAVQIEPGFFEALNNLAVALQRLGQLGAAEACYREVLRLAPENLETQLNYAALQGELGYYREGLEIVERVLSRAPEMVRAHLIASELERELGRLDLALAWVERAMAIAPDRIEIRTRRAVILCGLGRWDAAIDDCDRVIGSGANHAEALHARALALQGLNRSTAALEAFCAAETASAAPAPVITDRAWLLAEMGHKDEALAALDHALSMEPDLATAWYYRASLTRYEPRDYDLAIMERIADNPDAPYRDRLRLSFALGKAFLEVGDGERAFARLGEGNRLRRAILEYDPDADARRFAEIAAIFSAGTLSRLTGCGHRSTRPIFVFGMPRSGTTLVEHILASHPLVHGAGEPTHLGDIAEALGPPARVLDLTPDDFAVTGRRYLDLVGANVPDTLRLVDKMPSNFMHAGLISVILPGARMIHCRRDPLDTCLSCYSLLFARGQEYSYDLGELGRFYRLYLGLMEHWRRVLPPEALLEIDYETLVRDTQGEVRKILGFCGLPWDAACLRFHQTSRRVTSASLDQVRSPVFTKSIGRAQPFRRWLGPLELASPAHSWSPSVDVG